MLEDYFVRPCTVDRIRESWLGQLVERYVEKLEQDGYGSKTVHRRIPILVRFGDFAKANGAQSYEDLPRHVDAFVAAEVRTRGERRCQAPTTAQVQDWTKSTRAPVEQAIQLAVPSFHGHRRRPLPTPFAAEAPDFLHYLRDERGLRESSIKAYKIWLRGFERYLMKVGIQRLAELSPPILSAFVADTGGQLSKSSVQGLACTLRVFLRFIHREGVVPSDLSPTVEVPRIYQLSNVPRSISWSQVRDLLEAVDRRDPVGKRDYAILLLLVTYGLRAREVALLSLDDIDWERDRLRVPDRKAGHSTAFPLSRAVGTAILDYLQNGRPKTSARQVFFRATAPRGPMTWGAIALRVGVHLRRAGISVRRAGSHTLRHTCVQRLVEAQFSMKEIGDYIGHRSPDSTNIYAKVDVEALRQVASGTGEAVL